MACLFSYKPHGDYGLRNLPPPQTKQNPDKITSAWLVLIDHQLGFQSCATLVVVVVIVVFSPLSLSVFHVS